MNYKNFTYSFPTKYVFGKDCIEQLGSILNTLHVKRMALFYGGKSIRLTGIYDKLLEILKSINIDVLEIGGCSTNPKTDFIEEKTKLICNYSPDILIAVGGGSVIDVAKAIALYATNDQSKGFWPYMKGKQFSNLPMPLGTILTLPASGSESNSSYVITNADTGEKVARANQNVIPTFAICDPSYTKTLSRKQLFSSCSDILSHLFEQLFVIEDGINLTDHLILGSIKSVMESTEILLNDFENLDARGNIMLASSFALCYLLSCGRTTDWVAHSIEHAISGQFNTSHGEGLSIIMPNWIEFAKGNEHYKRKLECLSGYLNEINVDGTVERIKRFYKNLGLSKTVSELINDQFDYETLSKSIIIGDFIGKVKTLSFGECVNLLKQMDIK